MSGVFSLLEKPAVDAFTEPPAGVNPERLLSLNWARAARAIHAAAVELNAFDHFVAGPRTANEVADASHWHPTMTHCLLDGLASLAWLKRSGDRYQLTPTARFFLGSWTLRDVPEPPDPFWSRLPEMLRNGRIGPWRGYGGLGNAPPTLPREEAVRPQQRGTDWSDPSVQRHLALITLGGGFHRTFDLLAEAGVFRQARTLLDVAAGHGLFAVGFKKRIPALDVTILDLPDVVPIAQRFVEEHGLAGRIGMIPGNIHEDGFEGAYDVVFVSQLGAARPRCEALFRNAYERLNSGGVLVYKEIAPRRYWSEAFYPLAHRLLPTLKSGDPNAYEIWWPPTAEAVRALMRDVGFSSTRFLGWVGHWSTISAGWK